MKLSTISTLFFGAALLSGCGRVSPARLEKAAAAAAERRAAGILARDLARDDASRAIELGGERRVYKYTTESEARGFEREGFPPNTHFTASDGPGHPLSGSTAQKRFGLSYTPDRRLGVTLPGGTAVKPNQVIGGAPGYGELRVEQPLPPASIRAESVLRPGHQ